MSREKALSSKIYVLDTNILLHEPLAFLSFKENDVVVPMTVLEELDYIKDSKKDVARDARVSIRAMENLLHDANRIINSALYLQKSQNTKQVVLVTKDINMRLKAKGAGLAHVEDYRTDQMVTDIKYLSKGYHQFSGNFWDEVKSVDSRIEGRDTIHTIERKVLPEAYVNEFLLDDSQHFAGLIESVNDEHLEVLDLGYERLMGRRAWGVAPKNIGQAMSLHALLDPHIDLVILTGPAGSGKTLLALAAALEMVVEKNMYDKIIVTRSTPEIGFLPGTEEEKMAPWLAAITDSLEVLHKNDENVKGSMNYIMEKANIQFKSVNFMRGRSIQNAIVILDESQNLTASQLKTIITRCGEGTKLICSGNLAQIDSNYLSAVTSGLTYIVEKFKNFSGSATINLDGVVRSRLAEFAEEQL